MRSASSTLVDTSLIGPACMQTVQIPRSGSSGLPSSPSVFVEENMMPPQFGQIPMKCGPTTIGAMEFDETMNLSATKGLTTKSSNARNTGTAIKLITHTRMARLSEHFKQNLMIRHVTNSSAGISASKATNFKSSLPGSRSGGSMSEPANRPSMMNRLKKTEQNERMNVALSALTQRAPSHSATVVMSKAVIRRMTMSAMANITPALRSEA